MTASTNILAFQPIVARTKLPAEYAGIESLERLEQFLNDLRVGNVTTRSITQWNSDSRQQAVDRYEQHAVDTARHFYAPVTHDRITFDDVTVIVNAAFLGDGVHYQYDVYHTSSKWARATRAVIDTSDVPFDWDTFAFNVEPLTLRSVYDQALVTVAYYRSLDALPLLTEALDRHSTLANLRRFLESFGIERFGTWTHTAAQQVYTTDWRTNTVAMTSCSPTIDAFTFGALRVTIHDAMSEQCRYDISISASNSLGEDVDVRVQWSSDHATPSDPLSDAAEFNAARATVLSIHGVWFNT
jgi:hypothetical protein